MDKPFLEELNSDNVSGVAYKNVNLKKIVLGYFSNVGNATISDLCKELNLSIPKVTTLINDLIQDGLVQDYGKVESTGGRKPNLYGLVPNSAFFIGVDVKHNHINIGVSDLQKNLIKVETGMPYQLKNNQESLESLCQIINRFISELSVPKDKILGVGVNLTGRINYATGYSYSFFYFNEEPLSRIIEAKVGIRVFIENDSRAMAYGEFCVGNVKGEKDVLFLNLDYGIGMGILINGELYYGKSGFSGEIGHIPLFDNEIICHCGKKGCLETEASGSALIRMFRERLTEGSTSIITRKNILPNEVQLQHIIDAANHDDVLAIELLGTIGEHLGKGIALLINIFNPELVILGGSLAETEDYIRLPIRSAMNKYSLSMLNNATELKMSRLGEQAGVIGACLLVWKRLLA
ncbi:transcriptional regulator of PTS gene [Catalinimonas alkaloidigena]|uniref:ROK family transcriptional regulator n=1 Tax=Catalinimonas alkaloidigena TaxID=1075417 RepID=UPI00240641B2|nr:ROK family transcriptional regulator [Catalinimonas alkaloidigena]MDF9797590.1 transcriptional regulator of PTS gene [Catalinimonas alkaloidigena]